MTTEPPVPRWRPGRFRLFWVAIWLVFLADPFIAAWQARDTVRGAAGLAVLLAFVVGYVVVFFRVGLVAPVGTGVSLPRAVAALVGMILLTVAASILIGESATATAVFVSVLSVILLPRNVGMLVGLGVAGLSYAIGFVVPGWEPETNLLLSGIAATIAIFGVAAMRRANAELRVAYEENQRLAVEQERNRFARDLHDILGHSLSVITLKAQLARKLMPSDPDQAAVELTDLERLSRDALQDVRRTVEGYRDLTIPGELARARIALQAAQIEADLPTAADDVPTELRETFAWAIREGVTNVIRHSGAEHCQVRLAPDRVSITDDGHGPNEVFGTGSGLLGLRERAVAVGATLVTGRSSLGGFLLEVAA